MLKNKAVVVIVALVVAVAAFVLLHRERPRSRIISTKTKITKTSDGKTVVQVPMAELPK